VEELKKKTRTCTSEIAENSEKKSAEVLHKLGSQEVGKRGRTRISSKEKTRTFTTEVTESTERGAVLRRILFCSTNLRISDLYFEGLASLEPKKLFLS